jgi:NAD(P)-dependent dehydrogenase (short-subunit alcohol dehydrogenase family)
VPDQIVVVIGVGGMGQLIARRQGPGHKVLLADFNQDTLHRVVGALQNEGYDVAGHRVDVSDRASVAALTADAAAAGDVVEVIHTAGLSPQQASAQAILRVDLLGVAHVLEEFGEVIAPLGAGLVIASMAGRMAAAQMPVEVQEALANTPADELLDLPFLHTETFADAGAAYAMAKRANQVRVQAASVHWGKRGARLNSISPGIIATPMSRDELASDSGAYMRAMIAASGAGRIGTAADIANAAAFLLGPTAAFVNGTDLLVDGGVVAAIRSGLLAPTAPR